MTPQTFLPRDRDGALLFIKEQLYDYVQRIEALLGPHHELAERLNNLLDAIERS